MSENKLTLVKKVTYRITKASKPRVCICIPMLDSNGLPDFNYPMEDGIVRCGSTGGRFHSYKVEDATAEEVKEWRHAYGLIQSVRARCNSDEKVKALKWVAIGLDNNGGPFIENGEYFVG